MLGSRRITLIDKPTQKFPCFLEEMPSPCTILIRCPEHLLTLISLCFILRANIFSQRIASYHRKNGNGGVRKTLNSYSASLARIHPRTSNTGILGVKVFSTVPWDFTLLLVPEQLIFCTWKSNRPFLACFITQGKMGGGCFDCVKQKACCMLKGSDSIVLFLN